jgi:hypothetical protein
MPMRSPLLVVAALSLACSSSAHEIGTLGSTGAGASGAMGGSSAGSSGTSGGVGQGGSGGGAGLSSGSAASGDVVASGGSVSLSGVSAGSSSSGVDASMVPSADAGGDRVAVASDASSGPFPARIVFFYTPLGTVLDSWRPMNMPSRISNGQFSLTGILAPLQPFKDHVLVVDGVDNLASPSVPSTDQNGPALLLTGEASGPSLGTKLMQTLGAAQVPFPSVQLGVQSSVAVDFSGPAAPEPPSNSPGTTASLLFSDRPPIAVQFTNTNDFVAAGHQQMDLMHLAIQYDKTRVLSLSWGDVRGITLYNWVAGVDKDYRTLAANSGVAGPDRDHFIAAQTWLAQQFAYLVNSLASTPEGNGSLLDHTLLVWISETGESSVRTGKNIPIVIAGNMNGRFRNGAYVQTTGSQASFLSTIASVAGIGAFGDPALGNTPISVLLN